MRDDERRLNEMPVQVAALRLCPFEGVMSRSQLVLDPLMTSHFGRLIILIWINEREVQQRQFL